MIIMNYDTCFIQQKQHLEYYLNRFIRNLFNQQSNIVLNCRLKMIRKLLTNSFFNFAKICKTPSEAIEGLKDGDMLMVGGFLLCGVPMNLLNAVRQKNIRDLTTVSNEYGRGDLTGDIDWGVGILLQKRQVKKAFLSYFGINKRLEHMYLNGQIEAELVPQGTFVQKIRSGGAGIPAFYTRAGADTLVEQGKLIVKYEKGTGKPEKYSQPKRIKIFNGMKYLQEQTLFGDFAIIKAKKADKQGNLYFSKTARNFNADIATAAKVVVAQVEQIVQNGDIAPEDVHVPGVYIDRIFQIDPNSIYSKKIIQKYPIRPDPTSPNKLTEADKAKYKIAKRLAKEVKNGMNVNLGVGIPLLLPGELPADIRINIHCQNGVFRVGPTAYDPEDQDPDLINPGKQPITILPGASFFNSSTSFAIIRGKHLDLTVLGALQCSSKCDIANWIIPGKMVRGMGGAMDLVASGSDVIVTMTHFTKNKKTGEIEFKLLDECTLPVTAKGVVSTLITELAVFKNVDGEFVLTEIAEETTLEEVQKYTGFTLKVAPQLKRF